MKTLGIDYGTKNIGLAVSDEDEIIAGRYTNLLNHSDNRASQELVELIEMQNIGKVLLGFPFSYNHDETRENDVQKRIRRLKTYLEKHAKVVVVLWDESFSSSIVEKDMRGKARKASDSEAARLILQEYLDNQSMMNRAKKIN